VSRHAPAVPARGRWTVLAVLVLVRLSLGVAFQAPGAVAPALMRDLGLDAAAIGALAGLFLLPGLALAVPIGVWAQRTGDRPLVLGGIALMAAGALLCAAAGGFAALALGRLTAGAGAVALMVLLNKTVQDWFAGRELFLPMSLYLAAWPVGIALGQSGLGALAESPGAWPTAFLLSAGLLLLALAGAAAAPRSPPPGGGAVPPPPPGGPTAAGRERLIAAEVRLVCLAGAAWTSANSGYLVLATFGPLLLVERGAGPAAASLATS
jgi:DHA1 family inner membrane transport protein